MYPLKAKGDAIGAFVQFENMAKNQLERKIKVLWSDGGTEFKLFVEIVQRSEIVFRHSCPYTSVQIGRAERKHRQVVEMGLTMLAQASLPLQFWVDAFQAATSFINRHPIQFYLRKILILRILKYLVVLVISIEDPRTNIK